MTEIQRLQANAERCAKLAKLATESVTANMLTSLAQKYSARVEAFELARRFAKGFYLDTAE